MSETKTTKEELVKFTKPIVKVITAVTPYVITSSQKAWAFYKSLPEDYLQLIIGFTFCFFGGIFPVLFAAIEAAKHGGINDLAAALSDLSDEALKVIEASKKDDDLDEDGDGKKDVDQADTKALLVRKTNLVLTKMNPQKIDKAISQMYKVWLSVVAVLSVQFARTIALSVSISAFLKKPTDHLITPLVQTVVPDDYDRWIPVLMGWITKSIGMSIAWYINAIITAFTSALTGALIISRALLKIAHKKGMTLNGLIPADDKDTYIDEAASYVFAFLGIWFQFKLNFELPFPFNMILLPVELAEQLIRWSITKA